MNTHLAPNKTEPSPFKQALDHVLDNRDLPSKLAEAAMNQVTTGEIAEVQLAAFLAALRTKGETSEELLGFARSFRSHLIPVRTEGLSKHFDYPPLDTCGTGGDGKHTFNVSTVSAFVIASCGVPVLKHGNRSVSSSSGSADLFSELAIKTELTPEQIETCALETGMAFLFAPSHHPAMRYVAPVRKQLAVRTAFNMLGPLLHPAGVKHQIVGTFDKQAALLMAQTLKKLGSKSFMVVHSQDGYDEISVFAPTTAYCIGKTGDIEKLVIDPKELGLSREEGGREKIAVTNATQSAKICMEVLNGEKGPARDMVIVNAAAGLHVAGRAASLKEGVQIAENGIDSKKALAVLDSLQKYSS